MTEKKNGASKDGALHVKEWPKDLQNRMRIQALRDGVTVRQAHINACKMWLARRKA